MVGILEKIKLVIENDRVTVADNPFGEKGIDYICENEFIFERGKIYGIICEHGGGGETISLLLSNEIPLEQEKIYIDDTEITDLEIEGLGWYMGKILYSREIIKKEQSIRKALENAVKKYHTYSNISEIVEDFHLTPDRLDYGLSRNCEWEKWRASLAIGYANHKKIFCFPWMNTMFFYDCMYNSSVFRLFKKLTEEGAIIILPTSRKENVKGIADNIIPLHSPRFEHVISESSYFKEIIEKGF